MPLGYQGSPQLDNSGVIVPVGPTQVAPAPPDLAERQAGKEIWAHRTLEATTTDWPDGLARVTFPGPVTKLEVLAPAGVELYIGLDRTAGPAANQYDLKHPGTGLLSDRVPRVTTVYLSTGTGIAPSGLVDVWGKAGSYAL